MTGVHSDREPGDNDVMSNYDVITIGSGPAGEKAATQAAYFGYRVAMIEQASTPGGAMVNTGTLPTKTLRETALVCTALRRRPIPGLDMELVGGLSLARLMARKHLVQMQEHDRIESAVDRHEIDVFNGRGRLAGPNTVEVVREDGATMTLETRHTLISTGSRPVQPDFIPFDHPNITDADGILDFHNVPHSLIIVGAGVIGCEYASIFAELGAEVTVVHPRETILDFLDAECRDRLVEEMKARNIRFTLGQGASAAEGFDGGARLTLDDGTVLEAEALLWAAGRQPNSNDIGLETVGIEPTSRGHIPVDSMYQTTCPGIYAAGDVIGFPALASTSMEQGRIAACHMFGIDFKKELSTLMPMGIYTIPAVSSVGMSETEARETGHDVVVGRAPYRTNARGRMLGDERGLAKCVYDRSTRKLLGACIVGEDATELIHIAQSTLLNDAGIDTFINTCFNYPSLSELYKYTAYDALRQIAASGKQPDANAA